jgi:hypothetical protein
MLIVTSVYNASYENILQFTKNYNLELLVYNKNDKLNLGEEIVTYKTEKLTIIDIPNYGRCDYAFLYYIIKHYNNLPNKILFTKANFTDQNIQLHYVLENNNFMLVGKHIKYGVLNKEFDKSILKNKGVSEYDIEELFYNKNNTIDPCFQSYLTNDFYNIVYGDKLYPDDYVINFGHGPCFSVTKEIILSHTIDIYNKLLDIFYPNKNHWSKWEGHSEEETYFHLGKRYHDNLQRFWILLFVKDYKNQNVKTDNMNFITLK